MVKTDEPRPMDRTENKNVCRTLSIAAIEKLPRWSYCRWDTRHKQQEQGSYQLLKMEGMPAQRALRQTDFSAARQCASPHILKVELVNRTT